MKKIFASILLLFVMQAAWALDIHEAKNQGLVGESNSGYLAAVKSPASADVQALIKEVNGKRKAQFEQAATKTSATVPQVANRFYELAVQKTQPGHYYQDAGGNWKKK